MKDDVNTAPKLGGFQQLSDPLSYFIAILSVILMTTENSQSLFSLTSGSCCRGDGGGIPQPI